MAPIRYTPFQRLLLPNDEAGITTPSATAYYVFQAEEAAVITHVGFHYAGGLGEPPEQIASLQGVNPSSGQPDGVVKGSAIYRPGTGREDPPQESWIGTWQWVELNASYACQRGEKLSVQIAYQSGGIGSGEASFYAVRLLCSNRHSFPYAGTAGGASTTKFHDPPLYGYKSSTKVYGRPIVALDRGTFSAPNQRGLRFVLEGEWGQKWQLLGLRWHGRPQGGPGNLYDMILYEGEIEKQRVTIDADQSSLVAFGETSAHHDFVSDIYFDDETLQELFFDTEYFLVLEPKSNNQSMNITCIDCGTEENITAYPGGGEFYLATRANSGASWTRETTKFPLFEPIPADWGRSGIARVGLHVNFNARYNDNIFIQHANDQICLSDDLDGDRHEVPVSVIGDAIKSYGGFKTVEVFKDPDDDFSPEFIIAEEQLIEELKIVKWDPYENGLIRLVFRFRAETESTDFTDVEQYVRVVVGAA